MIDNDKIEITWTSENMFVTFNEGSLIGQTYKWPGERLTGGRFWTDHSRSISQIEPEKRTASNEERNYVLNTVRRYFPDKVVLFDD